MSWGRGIDLLDVDRKREKKNGIWEMMETQHPMYWHRHRRNLSTCVICLQAHFALIRLTGVATRLYVFHRYSSSRGVQGDIQGDIQGDTRRILLNETVTDRSMIDNK